MIKIPKLTLPYFNGLDTFKVVLRKPRPVVRKHLAEQVIMSLLVRPPPPTRTREIRRATTLRVLLKIFDDISQSSPCTPPSNSSVPVGQRVANRGADTETQRVPPCACVADKDYQIPIASSFSEGFAKVAMRMADVICKWRTGGGDRITGH